MQLRRKLSLSFSKLINISYNRCRLHKLLFFNSLQLQVNTVLIKVWCVTILTLHASFVGVGKSYDIPPVHTRTLVLTSFNPYEI